MQRALILAWVCGLILTAAGLAGEPPAVESPAPVKAIGLVPVGSVDAAFVERVRSFVEGNTALPVRVLPSQKPAGKSLDEEGTAAGKWLTGSEVCLVVLVEPTEDIQPHGVLLPNQHVAVVNVKSLRPVDGDAEKYGRRLEREVMQSIGLLLGIEPCPNPQCALWAYKTDEELDIKGRNFCPPCLNRVQKAARERGVKLIESSPFLVH
jgi:hypothetical protein